MNIYTPLYKAIEQHALFRPNKPAVLFERTQLTYTQLNIQANRLAHGLLNRNVTRGSVVVVHITPSVNILVSLLAIHKIGCVYVPVDPTFPVSRVNAILNEVNPAIILFDYQLDAIPPSYLFRCHRISDVVDLSCAHGNPDILVTTEDISHIYFTSGTTGKPKGVLATHANLFHYVSSAIELHGFSQNDTFLAAAKFTFSISMFELMVPLVMGGCVRVLPREAVLDLNRLSRAVASATVFHFGPSLLKQLLPYIDENYRSFEPFDRLVHVSSGGDMVPPDILEKLKKIFRNAEVFVIYGSSEISCMGCAYGVPRDKAINRTLVGKPYRNVKVRILNREGNTVPIGVSGQIFFGGSGLVNGYLNLPELTLEKFPLIDGERYYAIGDIGRFDQEGNIELLGREDFQVQIRGMRIEIPEVEACLKSYPAVTDCVVVGRPLKENEEKSLIAYLVAGNGELIIASDLKAFVAAQLPDYMIPAIFVRIDKLPVNHNAKLDRSQLPRPTAANIIVSSEFQQASNDVEQTLINIWENLFNIDNIGINHNFFELGGDSLLAISFLIEIDRKFGRFIPISIMLDAPTIREIARIVSSAAPVEGAGDVVVLRHGNTKPPLFCLYGVLLYKELAESLDTERQICGVYLEEEVSLMHKGLDSEEFKVFSSIENIAHRYLRSIREFQPHGPYFLCGVSFGGIMALEVARNLERDGEVVRCVAMFDTIVPGYMESLSRIKRIVIHLRLAKEFGWAFLIEKLRNNMKRLRFSVIKGNQSVNAIEDIRGKARDMAVKNYVPEFYDGEVILFRAKERSEFDAGRDDLGWGKFIRRLEVHEINGDHLDILKAGNVEKLANILLKKLE